MSTGTWSRAELAYVHCRYPNAPLCRRCGRPMHTTEPDQQYHPMCDPVVAEIIRRAA